MKRKVQCNLKSLWLWLMIIWTCKFHPEVEHPTTKIVWKFMEEGKKERTDIIN